MTSPGETFVPISPLIALLCTRGMEAFLSNALFGLLHAGVAPGQILVACPANAEDSVRQVTSAHSPQVGVLADISLPATADGQYASYGSPNFSDICWAKIALIRRLLDQTEHIVYADLDIGWLRDPLPYLVQVATRYPIACQTEGLPRFPPAICCGFMSLRRAEPTIEFLDTLLKQSRTDDHGKPIDDQAACQQLIDRDPAWLNHIYLLPEALFLNGLGYRNAQHREMPPVRMEGELQPFMFHANWTINLDSKRELLAAARCWFMDDVVLSTASTTSSDGGDMPLISVLYPVFDVRGDVAPHLRRWIDHQQQIGPQHFQIVVAASENTPVDEAALREVLRPRDVLLRVPGARQDTELWNAAAGAARGAWLLFVEGHGWPDSDALAALSAWIEANPDKRVCNFRIRNPDDYRVARLMKRWFAETQEEWRQPSTWPRLHRTAFALRRDVFDRSGPIEPFGQFGPPLLSAHLHQRNVAVSTLPVSGLLHEDAFDVAVHIVDTADYARGELSARAAAADPEFFENYFGPAPFHGADPIIPDGRAWRLILGLIVAARRRPLRATALMREAVRLVPSLAPISLRLAWLALLIKIDAFGVMRLPLIADIAWRRFRASHKYIVRAEQLRWMRDNPPPPIIATETIPAILLTQYAITGLHALEYFKTDALRWTHPACLIRLAAGRRVTVTLETRHMRPGLTAQHLQAVIAGGKPVSLKMASSGTIVLRAETPSTSSGVVDLVLVAPELREPAVTGQPGRRLGLPGRRLGLPLFAMTVEFD